MSFINAIRPQDVEDAQENASWYGGCASAPRIYAYVGNDPLNAMDPDGLWQVTVSGGYRLLGGSFTFGLNSGQWNVGAWLGVGAGFSARINPYDTGLTSPGFNASVKGQANYNLGTNGGGGFGLQHSFTSGDTTYNGSYSFGGGVNVQGSISETGDTHVAPTLGTGSSTFLGVGGTWASTPTQPAQIAPLPLDPSGTATPVQSASQNIIDGSQSTSTGNSGGVTK
jgi:hypothetical protein